MPATAQSPYAERLMDLLAQETEGPDLTLIAAATVSPKRVTSTKKNRNNAWKTLLADKAPEGMRIMRTALRDLGRLFGKVDSTPRILSDEDAYMLMIEYLAAETVAEATTARREMTKELVHEHVARVFEAHGVQDPYNKSGVLRVPSLSKKFCIEGAGYTEKTIDSKVVEDLLTPEEWEQVTDEHVVPESRVRTINFDKVADLISSLQDQDDDRRRELVSGVYAAVIPGVPKKPSFTVRDDDKEEDHEH